MINTKVVSVHVAIPFQELLTNLDIILPAIQKKRILPNEVQNNIREQIITILNGKSSDERKTITAPHMKRLLVAHYTGVSARVRAISETSSPTGSPQISPRKRSHTYPLSKGTEGRMYGLCDDSKSRLEQDSLTIASNTSPS